jgi:hypothetical protein
MRTVPLVTIAAAAIFAAACVTPYKPGSFQILGEPFVGDTVTAGCLDLAVKVARDPVATGPVVQYQFGNRCDRVATIDLKRVPVTGRTAAGEEVAMVAYDPYGAMTALPLDARTAGRERIEYRIAKDFTGDVVSICVAIGELAEPGTSRLAMTCHNVAPPTTTVAEVSP